MHHQELVTLEAGSPEELIDVLEKLTTKATRNCLYSALAISDPQFLIYPFNLKDTSTLEATKQTQNEIKEIYSLPMADIEYDIQIFRNEPNYISGICAAIPKKLLHRYLEILDKNKLVPLRIIPYTSAIVDYYFQKHKDPNKSFCIIDFSKKYTISLAVFKNDYCELLRQIPYEVLHGVIPEIIESLKNVCLMTDVKKLDHIYFAGTLEDKLDIIRDVEEAFEAKIERDHSIDVVTALSLDDYYFNINFARRYAFSPPERVRALYMTNLVLILSILFNIFLGFKIFHNSMKLKKLSFSYTLTDYDYAKNLKKEMDAL